MPCLGAHEATTGIVLLHLTAEVLLVLLVGYGIIWARTASSVVGSQDAVMHERTGLIASCVVLVLLLRQRALVLLSLLLLLGALLGRGAVRATCGSVECVAAAQLEHLIELLSRFNLDVVL